MESETTDKGYYSIYTWFQATWTNKDLLVVYNGILSDYGTLIGQYLHHTCKLFWISLLCKCQLLNISWAQVPADGTHSFSRLLFMFSISNLWHALCTQLLYSTVIQIIQTIWLDFVSLNSLISFHHQGNVINFYSKIHNIFGPPFLGFYMGI